MKKFAALLLLSLTAVSLFGQTNSPVRLALVAEIGKAAAAVDVLTAQLTSDNNVQLLERDQIEKVYREQETSAANRDDIKLGRILGADGLVIFNMSSISGTKILTVRFVAVNAGLVLADGTFKWPPEDMSEWGQSVADYLKSFLPKLTVSAKDAIPISIVNFRSAIQSAEAAEAEHELKLLVIQRLSQEPRLFVLERQKLQLLSEEKELKGNGPAFWDGRYLLEGAVDQNSFSADTVTISARLTPPGSGAPLSFEVSGPRANLAEVANHFAIKTVEALKINSTVKEWNSADEAGQFYNEANWALKWGACEEAQAASESAWALGKRDADTAMVRIRAYDASVPSGDSRGGSINDLFGSDISAQAIPDATRFEPLGRALDLLQQNAPQLFTGTNATASSFSLGLDVLHKSACLLESYYYAAELRAAQTEHLDDLKGKIRAVLQEYDEHLLSGDKKFSGRQELQQQYEWFEWEEGGICAEQPEDVLPVYRQLLDDGYQPEHLPRIIGWSWEDRKRVPGLMRQFIRETCASTNSSVQLAGLYLALLEAPRDEKGSLSRCENDLVSAMWENRQWLLSNPSNVLLVGRVKSVLQEKYEVEDTMAYFDHEPFASFYHNLRMDLLEHISETNTALLDTFFFGTSEKLETPDQARQLLPLMIYNRSKHPEGGMWDFCISVLKENAGIIDASAFKPLQVTNAAENVLEAKFIKWNLQRPGITPGYEPYFKDMIVRSGMLCVHACYRSPNGPPISWDVPGGQDTWLLIDPMEGVKAEIPFPAKFGGADNGFEVADGSLFVSAQDHLYRYKFQGGTWEEIPAPLEGRSQLVWLKGSLYASRSDGLLKINPDSKSVEILVSTRRQPALNKIDPLWKPRTQIYARSDGKLGAIYEDSCLSFDPDKEEWAVRTLLDPGPTNYFPLWALFTSADGAQILLTGGMRHRYLLGYWNDDQPAEPLLMELASNVHDLREGPPKMVRWDWPPSYPLEPSSILAENQKLWVLCPGKVWHMGIYPDEPIKFLDNRQATLFCFESQDHKPFKIPIHFEENEDALVQKAIVNGQPVDMFSDVAGSYPENWDRLNKHIGNAVFWLKTPEGFVYGAPGYCGHWLIPNSALETMQTGTRASTAP